MKVCSVMRSLRGEAPQKVACRDAKASRYSTTLVAAWMRRRNLTSAVWPREYEGLASMATAATQESR